MAYVFGILVLLAAGAAYYFLVYKKKEAAVVVPVPQATFVPVVVPSAPVVTAAPPGFTPTAAGPLSNAVIGMLGGVPTGNGQGMVNLGIADPYGDHNGFELFGDGGYVWAGPGQKRVTIKALEAGKSILLSTADSRNSVTVSLIAPSGTKVASFDAPAGEGQTIVGLQESGDYVAVVDNAGPARTSLRFTRY